MNILRTTLYILTTICAFSATAQIAPPCPFPSPPGAESCQSACVYCDFDGYVGVNNGNPSGGITICGQISIHNDQWFAFVAGTESITFNINTVNCMNGDGLQVAILESCSEDAIVCNPGMAGNAGQPLVVSHDFFVPGQTYYLVLDGWSGDVCNFEIEVLVGSTLPPPPGQPTIPQGPTQVCPGATVVYAVPPVENAGYYQWTAPPGASINGQGNNVSISASDFDANIVTVTFGQAGGNICVTVGNACYSPSQSSCLNVVNQPIPITVLPQAVFPASDLPVVWNQPPYQTISSPGVFTLTSSGIDSHLGCDSTVRQTIKVISFEAANAFGNVYNDINNNGVWDNNGENSYVNGVVLQTSSGQTVTSNYYGTYAFAGLSPGDTIWAIAPTTDAVVSPLFHVFTNGLSFEYNFGIYLPPPPPASALGKVYNDFDNSGTQNAGETPFADGVLIKTSIGQMTTSLADGSYVVDNLLPGDTIWALPPSPNVSVNPPFRIFTSGFPVTYNFGIHFPPPPPDMVTGLIFYDFNNNGIFNAGETLYTEGLLLQSSAGTFATSNTSGTFIFDGLVDGDTIWVISPSPDVTVSPSFLIFTPSVTTGYNFGLYFPFQDYDFSVDLTNVNTFRSGFLTSMILTVKNKLPVVTQAAQAKVVLPDFTEFLYASSPPSSILGDTLTWDFAGWAPNQKRSINIHVNTAIGTPLGTPVLIPAFVLPVANDDVPTDNSYTLASTVIGSYDPNDKQVNPAYVTPSLLANGQPFEYTIRFQNTGNYLAEFVKVIDTLGNTVDVSTFRFISSSHPCSWKVEGQGVVEFFFENISLPDSLSNEPESHGFVKFSVQPKKDLALGSFVENFCDIYFDFNQPVRTNTAGTQVVYFVPGEGLNIEPRRLLVRPNPAVSHVFCDWKRPAPTHGRIRLFDLTGLPRLEVPVEEGVNHVEIDVQSLMPGLYFILLEAGDLSLTNKVIIVQSDFLGRN